MVLLADAALPEGLRIYAIGDIHGCLDAFREIEAAIAADLAARPVASHRVILIGDYIDRGPDSCGVLERVAALGRDGHYIALRGNHEALLDDFLTNPDGPAHLLWTRNGGDATLASYGLADPDPFAPMTDARRRALRDRLLDAMGPGVRGLLAQGLAPMARFGDYLFVHAGIDPDLPPERQSQDTLLWIREPFLDSTAEFEAVVVHGHTPSADVVVRPNRIGIDGGAVFGGRLICLVLEGRERWLLDAGGRRRLD